MNPDLENLLSAAQSAENLRVFLDYDGTLADFAPTPDTILPDNELISLMQKMVGCRGIYPAVISGRRLAHIQKLLPVTGLLIGGTYGLEMQLPNGQLFSHLDYKVVRPPIEQTISFWTEWIQDTSALYLEDKGWAVALHRMKDTMSKEEPILKTIRKLTEERFLPEGFTLSGNDRFLELAPTKANKTEAVNWILNTLTPPDSMVLYIGDDQKDEEALGFVQKKGGVGIRIAPSQAETQAQFLMQSPQELRNWLTRLVNRKI